MKKKNYFDTRINKNVEKEFEGKNEKKVII